MRGWRVWSREAAHAAKGAPIISTDYATIAELDWGLPVRNSLIAAGPRWRWFALSHPQGIRTALLIQSNRHGPPSPALFSAITRLGALNRQSAGVTVQAYTLYRVTLRPGAPAALLGRPDNR
jgi:hypothetical protein